MFYVDLKNKHIKILLHSAASIQIRLMILEKQNRRALESFKNQTKLPTNVRNYCERDIFIYPRTYKEGGGGRGAGGRNLTSRNFQRRNFQKLWGD